MTERDDFLRTLKTCPFFYSQLHSKRRGSHTTFPLRVTCRGLSLAISSLTLLLRMFNRAEWSQDWIVHHTVSLRPINSILPHD